MKYRSNDLHDTREEILHVHWRDMRNNLLFNGIQAEKWKKNTEETYFIKETLKIKDTKLLGRVTVWGSTTSKDAADFSALWLSLNWLGEQRSQRKETQFGSSEHLPREWKKKTFDTHGQTVVKQRTLRQTGKRQTDVPKQSMS